MRQQWQSIQKSAKVIITSHPTPLPPLSPWILPLWFVVLSTVIGVTKVVKGERILNLKLFYYIDISLVSISFILLESKIMLLKSELYPLNFLFCCQLGLLQGIVECVSSVTCLAYFSIIFSRLNFFFMFVVNVHVYNIMFFFSVLYELVLSSNNVQATISLACTIQYCGRSNHDEV